MATKAASTKKSPARKSASARTRSTATSAPIAATKNTFAGHVQSNVRSGAFWRALGAEFVGTLLLASVIIAGQGQPIFVLFALAGVILMVGAISGAHVNPAITIGALVTRRIGWFRAFAYILVQCLGAAVAFLLLNAFVAGAGDVSKEAAALGQTAPQLFAAADVSALTDKAWYVFFAELVGTAILGFAIANATKEVQDRVAAAFTGGLGIFIALMVAVSAASYVGASAIINPAVAIALHAYSWETIWPFAIYAVAPVIGAVVGFVLYDLHRGRN